MERSSIFASLTKRSPTKTIGANSPHYQQWPPGETHSSSSYPPPALNARPTSTARSSKADKQSKKAAKMGSPISNGAPIPTTTPKTKKSGEDVCRHSISPSTPKSSGTPSRQCHSESFGAHISTTTQHQTRDSYRCANGQKSTSRTPHRPENYLSPSMSRSTAPPARSQSVTVKAISRSSTLAKASRGYQHAQKNSLENTAPKSSSTDTHQQEASWSR